MPAATPISDAARASGAWNQAWDHAAAFDAEWMEKFLDMGTSALRKGVLEPKVYEFIAIAVDASCTHMYGPGVRRHIAKALDLGATPEEIMALGDLAKSLDLKIHMDGARFANAIGAWETSTSMRSPRRAAFLF